MKRLLLLVLILLSALSAAARPSKAREQMLSELDGYLRERDAFDMQKEDRIARLRHSLSLARDLPSRYDLCMLLSDEYFSYQFDSTQHYLMEALSVSERMGDLARTARTNLRLGYLYSKAGSYMEAYDRLYMRTDTTAFSPELMVEYLYTLFEFSHDLSGNSGMVERLSIPDRKVYRDRIYALIPPHSELWRVLKMDEAASEWRLAEADSVGRVLLASVPAHSREEAIYAYALADIAWNAGRPDDQFRFLLRSAESDIVNSVRDYAALTVLSQHLLQDDVKRSFRYLRISQEDAMTYNSKLRPWQISRFILDIEGSYEARQAASRRASILASVLLFFLVLLLVGAMYFLVRSSRSLRRAQAGLTEANELKEAYIARFLGYLSTNVAHLRQDDNRTRKLLKQGRQDDLLRELSLSTRSEDALSAFYQTLDATVLGLWPDFVEQFNALLRPEARIIPRRPSSLTTELRIFALIRLGIDDSKDIAALLQYSLSTIYNYKVSVKNGALGDRDQFEDAVKNIGKQAVSAVQGGRK